MNLISETLTSSICEQISFEIYNSNLYLFIAGYLRNKGLNNLSAFFMKQSEEEIGHSRKFFNFLTDMNAPVSVPEIDSPDFSIVTITDIAQSYLDREISTTNSINELKKLSIEEDNPVCEEFLREMISLQQGEYSESTDFMDKANLCADDWKFVMLWDLGIG